jgi:hypothetical protein
MTHKENTIKNRIVTASNSLIEPYDIKRTEFAAARKKKPVKYISSGHTMIAVFATTIGFVESVLTRAVVGPSGI